jgi:hypothetical protein
MDFEIPDPLKAEHEQLYAELIAAIDSGGAVGDAAKAVAELLHPHFVKEEAAIWAIALAAAPWSCSF